MHARLKEHVLISSIASTNFQKFVFKPVPIQSLETLWGRPQGRFFEDTLCGLADRLRGLGSKHTLEAEFWVDSVRSSEHHKEFLPKFKEKGRVRIVGDRCGGVQEWP
jgi:hypothetical protein